MSWRHPSIKLKSVAIMEQNANALDFVNMRTVCTRYYCDRCGDIGKTPFEDDFVDNDPEPTFDSEGHPFCCVCERSVDLECNHMKGTKEVTSYGEVHYSLTSMEIGEATVFHHYRYVENNGFICSFCGEMLRCVNPLCHFGTCHICRAPPGHCNHVVSAEHDGISCPLCEEILSCGSAICGMALCPSTLEPGYGDNIWQVVLEQGYTENPCNCHSSY